MPFVALAIGGSALLGASASRSAANTQAAAADRAAEVQREQFNLINQQQAPYRGYGYTALNQIGGMLGGQTPTYDAQGKPVLDAQGQPVMQAGSGYFTRQFGPEDLKTSLAPNYEFMLREGQRAARQRLNAGGSGGSDIDRGITRFAEDYASNAYQQAFNNFSAQRKDIYNTLAGIAGIGQTGQTATNQAATTYGTNASNLITGAGAAQAAGTVGAANAYGGALGQLGGMSYLNNLTRQPAPIQVGPTQAMQGSYTPIIG
tara:strand:+ start:42 stop:821 length:780 start_codon:yes stop_codon:yes gene_type:complete